MLRLQLTRADLSYICSSIDDSSQALFAVDKQNYQECGDGCECKSIEALCFTPINGTFKFEATTQYYADSCEQCTCNVFASAENWEAISLAVWGMAAPAGFSEAVPIYNKVEDAVPEGSYLSLYEKTYSEVTVEDGCDEFISCRFQGSNEWDKSFEDIDLPCGYLVFDVCQGTFACECSNGYWMTTSAMQNKEVSIPVEKDETGQIDGADKITDD